MSLGSLIWFISGTLLLLYAYLVSAGSSVPGVEELVATLTEMPSKFIYIAAFAAIFFEGLYIVGNFFPGATLVLILAVLSQDASWLTFILTIISIYIGWSLAGLINIQFARRLQKEPDPKLKSKDRPFSTWFPSFRAAYEVAQVVEGENHWQVLKSALRVRLYASIGAALYCVVLALLVDINEISNEEGTWSLIIVALIMLCVGWYKIAAPKAK